MKAFKDSSPKDNIVEGLVVFLLLFPVFALWIAAKRAGTFESGFVFATAVYTFIPICLLGLLYLVSKMLDPAFNNIFGALLIISWLFALGYAIFANTNENREPNNGGRQLF